MIDWGKCRCHRFGAEVLVVYGDVGDDDDGWPSYSVWIVPGTMAECDVPGPQEESDDRMEIRA